MALTDIFLLKDSISGAATIILCVLAIVIVSRSRLTSSREPPYLPETIPFVSNTYQYLTNVDGFTKRIHAAFIAKQTKILKFYMGGTSCYMLAGTRNIQELFGNDSLDANWFHLILMDKHWQMTKSDIEKFANDNSGRLETPLRGTQDIPEEQRYWLGHNRLYIKWLSHKKHTDSLATNFATFFLERLNQQPRDWATVDLFDTLKTIMCESGTMSLFGTQFMALNPEFVKTYWEFDQGAGRLIWGLPRWLMPRPYRSRDKLNAMTVKYIRSAWENFDWNTSDSDWDPHWGARISRETALWLRDSGFAETAAAGHAVGTLFGLHSNTIPITTWALMEIISNPLLLTAVREEVSQAWSVMPSTQELRLDAQKLVSLPLVRSLFVEILRLHVSYTVSRKVIHSVSIDGYEIPPGSLIQASTDIAHHQEAVWGAKEHPASEFWAWRHTKLVESTDEGGNPIQQLQFCVKGRPSAFFPFGGGQVICPGRHFAKQEILIAIAAILYKFDFEMVEWRTLDGKKSDRPAQDDRNFAGVIAMPPDRDLRMRWKRRF